MAYVKILKIRSRKGVGNAARYVNDKEKTDASKREKSPDLMNERARLLASKEGIDVGEEDSEIAPIVGSLVEYAANPGKTEERHLVTGINCTAHNAAEEMDTLIQYWKRERHITGVSRDAFHIIQSFDPKDNEKLTPEMVHEIGKEYCEALQYMDDKTEVDRHYMMLLCTHVDKEHIHNHIILCSYDIDSGRKFHECKDVYRQMREASDRLCKEHGLRIIEDPDNERKRSRSEHDAAKRGISWKENLRKDIEAMAAASEDWEDFVRNMKSVGYSVKEGKYVTYTDLEGHKVRDKTLGRPWTKEVIILQMMPDKEKKKRRESMERFYQEEEIRRRSQNQDISSRDLYDQDGHRRSSIELLILTAMEAMLEGDAWGIEEIRLEGQADAESREKERMRRRGRLEEAVNLARAEGITGTGQLSERMQQTGAELSHTRKELAKNKATQKKMKDIQEAIENYEAVKDLAETLQKLPAGAMKDATVRSHAAEIQKYKASKALLYRHRCSTPEQMDDFKERYSRVKVNSESLILQEAELKKKYKNLARIAKGIALAMDKGFLTGRDFRELDFSIDLP